MYLNLHRNLLIIYDLGLLWQKKSCQFWFVYAFCTLFHVLFTIPLIKICCVCRLIILVGLCGKHSWEDTRHGGLYLHQTVTTFAQESVSGLNLVILVSYCWMEKWWHFIFLSFQLSNEQYVLHVSSSTSLSGALLYLHASLFTITVLCWQQAVECLPLF